MHSDADKNNRNVRDEIFQAYYLEANFVLKCIYTTTLNITRDREHFGDRRI